MDTSIKEAGHPIKKLKITAPNPGFRPITRVSEMRYRLEKKMIGRSRLRKRRTRLIKENPSIDDFANGSAAAGINFQIKEITVLKAAQKSTTFPIVAVFGNNVSFS